MTARSPSALLLSATLHGLIVAIVLFFTYVLHTQVKEAPKVFELVAGGGDNYAATVAPALGTSGGIKLAIPEPPAPQPVAPAAPEPVVAKAPVEAPPKPVETTAPNFSRQIKKKIARAEYKAKEEIKKEREAEQKRLTKAEFDKQNKAAKATAAGNPKVQHVDAEGISKGVVGGSTVNQVGGAEGKALTRAEGDLMDAYISLLKRKLRDALEKPPGVSDTLAAVAEFRINADGSLSDARISRSSGSAEFDRAVLDDIARFQAFGPRPDGKSETVSLTFRMKEEEEN